MPPKSKKKNAQKQANSKKMPTSASVPSFVVGDSDADTLDMAGKNALIDELRILNLNDQKDVVKAQLARAQKENEELRAQLGQTFVGEMFSLEELRSKAERSQEYAQAILLEGVAKEKEHQQILREKDSMLAEKDHKLEDALKEVEWLEVQVKERDQRLAETEDAVERAHQLSEELYAMKIHVNALKQELMIRNRQLQVLSKLDNHKPMDPADPHNGPLSPDPFASPVGTSLPDSWLAKSEEDIAIDGRSGMAPMLLEAMNLFQSNGKLQQECCALLAHLASDAHLIRGLARPDLHGPGLVLAAMHSHRMELSLQSSCCRLVTKFAQLGAGERQKLHAAGVVAMIIDTLTNFAHNEHRGLQYNSVLALKTLLPIGEWIITNIHEEEVVSDEEEPSPQEDTLRSPGQKVTGSLSERVRALKRQNSKNSRSPGKSPVLHKKNSSFSLPSISPVGVRIPSDGSPKSEHGSKGKDKDSKRIKVDMFETCVVLISCLCWCKKERPMEKASGEEAETTSNNNSNGEEDAEDILVQALRLQTNRYTESAVMRFGEDSPGSSRMTSRGSSRNNRPSSKKRASTSKKRASIRPRPNLDELVENKAMRMHFTSIPTEEKIRSRGASRQGSSRRSSVRSPYKQQQQQQPEIENPWTKVSNSKLVQGCCISLVLAVESDNTPKARRFLRHEQTMRILVDVMRQFRHDADTVAATCICLRISFESKKRSSNQLQQVRYIRSLEIDELLEKIRKIHPDDRKIHNEIQALTQKIKHASIMGI